MIEDCRQEEGKYQVCVKYANLNSHDFVRSKPMRFYMRWFCVCRGLTEVTGKAQHCIHSLVDLPAAYMN